ncbi:MAG: hypothetical protein GX194_08320 [Clostridium sp.]|nr:hypothetical protein [Clostridium sp.]
MKDILPKKLEVFNLLKEYELKNNPNSFLKDTYDVAIFLVGFSETPVILSLSALDVENYYFICTKDSEDSLKKWVKTAIESNYLSEYFKDKKDRIINAINSEEYTKIIKNEGDITAGIFAHVKEIVQKCDENDKIVFDITCGKKTMSSASFAFATVYGRVKMVYIDYEEYLPDKTLGIIPRSGTEFMYPVVNLNKLFRFSDFKNIEKLMNSHQYDAAYSIVEKMHDNMEQSESYGIDFKNEKQELKKLKNTLDFYRKWDEYDYKEAISVYERNKESVLFNKEIIDVFSGYPEVSIKSTGDSVFRESLKEKMFDVASNEKLCPYVLIDRYCNAVRKYEKGDYLDYVIRISSIVELGTYYYIIKKCDGTAAGLYEIKNGSYKYFSKENKEELKKELLKKLLNSVSVRLKLVCNGYADKTDYKFNSQIKCGFNDLLKITEERNQLSIVHGVLPGMSKEGNGDYKKTIKEFIIKICKITEDEFNSIKDKLTFKKLKEICNSINVYLESNND